MKKYKILLFKKNEIIMIIYTNELNISNQCFDVLTFVDYDCNKNLETYKTDVNDVTFNLELSREKRKIYINRNNEDPLNVDYFVRPYKFNYPALIITRETDALYKGIWYFCKSFYRGFTTYMEKEDAEIVVKEIKKYFKNVKVKNILKNEK